MKMNKKTLLFFIIGILVLCSTVAQAATSKQRDANKIYDPLEVSIRINKKNVKFVIVNNRVDPKRWYYMTLEPKFVEYGDPLEPALMLINYQRYGANKSKSEIEEGAYFECIFDMSVDTKVLKELKSKLPKEVDRTRICFEPLPLDLVEMTLLGTEGKEIKIEADKTAGILPMDASYVRFATILDKNDANLLNIALNSNTGIGYSIRYNYSLVGTKKKTSIKYSLDGNKGDYETDSKEEFSDEINNYLKRKVNSLSFQRKLREQVKPVDDENVNVLDVGHSRNKQTSGKSNTTIEHIEKVAEFEYRGKNDFIKVCEGFLSLDKYSFDIIKRKIFLDTSDVLWQMAYLVMPDMGAVNPLAVKKIETSKKGEDLIVNLITTLTTEPVDVASNIPTEFTILLPGGGKIDMTFRKAQEGNWMNCSFTHWPTNSKSWNVVKELERIKAKDIPGFTVYVYSSTETEQKDIDRATAVLDQAGIKNIVYKKNIPIKHFTDEELRQWAEKEKASGTPLRDLYDKMAPQGMSVTDVRSQWHIVNEVYGVKK